MMKQTNLYESLNVQLVVLSFSKGGLHFAFPCFGQHFPCRIPGCKQFEKHDQVFIVIDNCDFEEFGVSRQNQAAPCSDLPIAEKEGLENMRLLASFLNIFSARQSFI
jgi:hypothetical protein